MTHKTAHMTSGTQLLACQNTLKQCSSPNTMEAHNP